ncbi:MAG TPA: hypothetical protein PLA94_22850, partial [Myxococcota bacterium]|nr:hypothetical protein [Myxococcota bacterium]
MGTLKKRSVFLRAEQPPSQRIAIMMTYLSLLHLACSPMDTQVVLEEVEDASFHVQAENGGDGTDFDPLAFVTPLSAAPLETTDGDNQLGVVQILTDLSTKESVELQSFGSWTRITDLDDGEVLDVAGDFVGTFDNLSYTAW